jgi:hypothetical protein
LGAEGDEDEDEVEDGDEEEVPDDTHQTTISHHSMHLLPLFGLY